MSTSTSVPGAARSGIEAEEPVVAAVRHASLPPLLAALAQATGDLSLLREELRPDPSRVQEPHGGMSGEQRATARALAAATIKGLDGGRGATVGAPTTDDLRDLIAFVLGQPVSDEYLPLLVEELAVSGEDLRAPRWRKDAIDPSREIRVVIVGAGMSGLAIAHRLQQAGVPCVIFEKNDDVGGTWFENTYPGCRVDVPNHFYSYSFAQRHDWPHRFSSQPVLLEYFRQCADELGVRPQIRFGTEVVTATWEDGPGQWIVTVRTPDGSTDEVRAEVLVSAVGQLNRPNLPDIPGRDSFGGPSFHSAAWDHTVDLSGKRVAVIGTGASGIQLIPAIAPDVAELYVCQRTPNWFLPTPEYYDPMPDEMQWLFEHVPFYSQWYRFWLFWRLAEGALPAARVDPAWTSDHGSVSELNDALRAILTQYLESEFADRPDLLSRVIPDYPPLAKRILLDNGVWGRTLKSDHVHLVTDRIDRITADGLVLADGSRHEVDVIVYATGFQASKFLMPMRITGRGGVDLHQTWGEDPRAYLGLVVPDFPNLYCMYGPNTNLVANGSITFFSECEASYVLGAIRLMLEQHVRSFNCRPQVFDHYNRRVDAANVQMAWGVSGVNSWYKNARGRITQNWPFSLLEFWQQTRGPNPADFELT